MQYDSFDPSDRIITTAPSKQIVEKLEERRFLLSILSILTIACVLFYFSLHFVDFDVSMNLRTLCGWVGSPRFSLL
jgi:hypothetical protein